jgi:hypothetical protein
MCGHKASEANACAYITYLGPGDSKPISPLCDDENLYVGVHVYDVDVRVDERRREDTGMRGCWEVRVCVRACMWK